MKGIAFTVEAVYVIVIVFTALVVMVTSLQQIDLPNYDSIQAMKVSHDMGEDRTNSAPNAYGVQAFSADPTVGPYDCTGKASARIGYYNNTQEVCMK